MPGGPPFDPCQDPSGAQGGKWGRRSLEVHSAAWATCQTVEHAMPAITYLYLCVPPSRRVERETRYSSKNISFLISLLPKRVRNETRSDAFLSSLPPPPFPFFHTLLTPCKNSNQSLSLLSSSSFSPFQLPYIGLETSLRSYNRRESIPFYNYCLCRPYPTRQALPLVEHSRNHVDFVPGSQALEGQDHTKRLSYTPSFPPSSARACTTMTTTTTTTATTTSISMAQFDNDMSPKTKPDAGFPKAPALPPRSALRASRLLATMPQKLSEHRPVLTPAAPHLLYLSSEEDVSSSADDFSDCDYSSDSEHAQKTPEQTSTCQDIARMVSVVFSGKPCIVQLSRRSISPSSSADRTGSELTRTSTEPILNNRKGSACSTSSAKMASQHPPRSSSIMSPISFDGGSHSFLNIDPFAAKPESEEPEPQLRKTAQMFKRTLSLVRKRSRPNLNPSASHSREALSIQTLPMQQVGEDKEENHTSTPRNATSIPPLVYHEMIAARRASSYSATTLSPVSDASSPLSPTKRIRQGFLTRRRSIRV